MIIQLRVFFFFFLSQQSEKESISAFLSHDPQDVSCASDGVREKENGLVSGRTFGFLPD